MTRWKKLTAEQKKASNRRVARWKERNREKHLEQNREYAQGVRDKLGRAEVARRQRERRAANPEAAARIKRRADLRKYGLSEVEYAALLLKQKGLCAICETDQPGTRPNQFGELRFPVDHCHDTGQVRGLLCGPCNAGIAMLRHDPARLVKAIKYLRKERDASP